MSPSARLSAQPSPRPGRAVLGLVLALAAALAGVPGTPAAPAPAWADAAAVAEKKAAALAAVANDSAEPLFRAKPFADLGALDDLDAAKAMVECVAALALRQNQLAVIHAQTEKAYEPFRGFSFHEQAEWDRKKRLASQLEQEEEKIQGLSVIGQAALTAISKMRNEAAVTQLERSAAAEADVRARAVLVGGVLSNPASKATELAKKAMKDESPLVRLTVLEALGARKDPAFAETLVAALKDPNWPLRRAAIRALAAFRDVKLVPHLVAAMQTEDGMLLEEYQHALESLTGAKLGHFPDAWRQWYEDHRDEVAGGAIKPPQIKATKVNPAAVNYYGIEAVSRKVLFVIDISGSMKEEIGGEQEQTGVSRKDQLTGPKIEIAKRMLSDAIHKLEPKTNFNIIYFNHQVKTFQDKLVPASPDMVGKADLEIMDCAPAGSTYAYGALRRAFEFAGVSGDPVTGKFDPLVDTIFFLSDGAPTDDDLDKAQPMEPEKILSAVREWNRLAKVRIHTIAIDPRIGKGAFVRFMKGLAAQNDGTYTEVGAK